MRKKLIETKKIYYHNILKNIIGLQNFIKLSTALYQKYKQ